MQIYRSIIIPAYSEEKFIGSTLTSLYAFLLGNNWLEDTEVIVVTADPKDNTIGTVSREITKFPINQHLKPGARVGKGRDVRLGLTAAKGDCALFMDADLATPLEYLIPAFSALEMSGGMVMGVRELSKMHKTITRRISSRLSNTLVRLVVGFDIADSQCGFKGFDRNALEVILPRSKITGWGFDFEFIKIAKTHKLNISFVPVPKWHDPKAAGEGLVGDSQFDAMKQTLKELLMVKKNQIKGKYK